MKFNEFIALDEQLKKEGSSINEFVKQTIGKELFEAGEDAAPEEIDNSGKAGIATTLNPKAAIYKKKLTNAAKKILELVKTDLIEKYYGNILTNQKKVFEQYLNLKKSGKEDTEIITELAPNIESIKKIQQKQIEMLNKSMDKIITNSSARIDSVLEKSGVKPANLTKLQNYWELLSAQVYQISYNMMIKKQTEFLNGFSEKNPETQTLAKKMLEETVAPIKAKKVQKKKETEKKKAEQKPAEQTQTEEKPAEQTQTEEKPAEQKPAEQKPAEQTQTEEKPAEQTITKKSNSGVTSKAGAANLAKKGAKKGLQASGNKANKLKLKSGKTK